MEPLYFLVSIVLVGWHQLWGGIFGPTSGISWALSIIGLTLVIRAALIPLFVKQIKSSRNMQLLQPRVIQMPIFIALFRLIDQAAKKRKAHGVLTTTQAGQLRDAELFGGKISSTFLDNGGNMTVQVIAAVLVLAMTATTFLTQRQLM